MKKSISTAVFAFCILLSACSFSQGTAINNTGSAADNSAGLDVNFPDKGVLIPRMTTTERNSIVSPALGLQIFNTTTNCFNFWTGGSWKQICGECDFGNPVATNNSPVCEGDTLKLMASSIAGASYQWSGPDGFSSSLQNPIIAAVTIAAEGTYSVSATVNGCTSQQQNTVSTINELPAQPSAITGNSSPCEGSAGNIYSVTNVNGISYTWTVPGDWIITGGQTTNTITVTAGSLSGNITVVPANNCGNGTSVSLAVTGTKFASGGTETTISGYRIHTFTTSGTLNINSICGGNVEVLVVAGGGGGAYDRSGGGGAGGLVYNSSFAVSASQSITVTVGNGGAGATSYSPADGGNGGNSVFGTITATGGGGGRFYGSGSAPGGGSGGGGGTAPNTGGGLGTPGQGNNGGNGNGGSGGGGGAGAVGGDGGGQGISGNGGAGLSYSVSGTTEWYAGGGGGGACMDCPGTHSGGIGGTGGGGDGGNDYGSNGSNGAANTGGGGGGGSNIPMGSGGNGGSGIVIVRYPVP